MNSILKIFFILSLSLLLIRCEKETSSVINLEPTEHKEFNLGKVTDVIQLETSEKSLLEKIDKAYIDFSKDRIFVLSGFNVYFFNTNGEFIAKLKKGKGPGEINFIVSFAANPKNQRIYALDYGNTIYVFDYNGNFISSHKLTEFYSLDIHPIDDDNVFLYCNYVGRKEKKFVGIYNFSEKKVIKKFISSSESPYAILARGNANNFRETENRLFFNSSNIFGLYEFKADSFQRVLTYNLGDRAVPESFYKKYVEKRDRTNFGEAAKKRNYVPYLINSFYFNKHYLAIIDDDAYSCYAIEENNSNNIYMNGQLSDYFSLPKVESLKMPVGVQDDILILSCSPIDFFENDIDIRSKTIDIGDRKVEIKYDSNPFLILIK